MPPRVRLLSRRDWILSLGPTAVLAVLLPETTPASYPIERSDAAPLSGEFVIGKEGRLILLPVRLAEQDILCLVDTGASFSGFDESLRNRLGEVQGRRILQTPAGRKQVEIYNWPDARLRDQVLETGQPVVCINLEHARRATNEPILGVIGMDVLRKCRLQVDFDQGTICFLESLSEKPDELGKKIPIELGVDGSPFLIASAGDDVSERFLIDTGADGSSLRKDFFDRLVTEDRLRLGSSFASVTVAGEVRGDRGRLSRLSIGPFTHEDLRFSRVNVSSLGLRYLSRFRATFDFPGNAVYLQPGARYAIAEPRATSGLTLNWLDGNAVVVSVSKGGPGQAAGLKPGDVLTHINGKDAVEYDPFALRQLLTSVGGKRVPVTIRRGSRTLDLEIVLADG